MASRRISRLFSHVCNAPASEPEVTAEVAGAVAALKLNNPKALNALTVNMCELLLVNIRSWHTDPAVTLILLTAAGKAFSAGGDVKFTILDRRNGGTMYEHQFAMEYTLMHWVAKCSKPIVSLINGATLGCGAGLVTHGRFRVVTEKASLTMPETGIGIFPDVGMSYVLPRLRSHLGVFAGLSSHRFNAKELISTGLATHFVPSGVLPNLEVALRQDESSAVVDEAHVASIIERFSCEPPADMRCSLLENEGAIDRCFRFNTMEEIVRALQQEQSPSDSAAWAADTLKILRQKSPTSLHMTLRAMQMNMQPGVCLDDALKLDYRMIVACSRRMPDGDFDEGVSAVLIDKTGKPSWKPATIEEVTQGLVSLHFENLGEKELKF